MEMQQVKQSIITNANARGKSILAAILWKKGSRGNVAVWPPSSDSSGTQSSCNGALRRSQSQNAGGKLESHGTRWSHHPAARSRRRWGRGRREEPPLRREGTPRGAAAAPSEPPVLLLRRPVVRRRSRIWPTAPSPRRGRARVRVAPPVRPPGEGARCSGAGGHDVLGEASREVRRRPASSELVPPDPDSAAGAQDGALARTDLHPRLEIRGRVEFSLTWPLSLLTESRSNHI